MSDISENDARNPLAELKDGWGDAMGVRYVRGTPEEVVAELTVEPRHLQPYGIVHGGVHAGLIESVCSVGAALAAAGRGQSVVGLENHTSFIRAARSGRLTATATPVTRGRRTQVWEATVRDEAGRVMATGRVRLLALDPDSDLAGERV